MEFYNFNREDEKLELVVEEKDKSQKIKGNFEKCVDLRDSWEKEDLVFQTNREEILMLDNYNCVEESPLKGKKLARDSETTDDNFTRILESTPSNQGKQGARVRLGSIDQESNDVIEGFKTPIREQNNKTPKAQTTINSPDSIRRLRMSLKQEQSIFLKKIEECDEEIEEEELARKRERGGRKKRSSKWSAAIGRKPVEEVTETEKPKKEKKDKFKGLEILRDQIEIGKSEFKHFPKLEVKQSVEPNPINDISQKLISLKKSRRLFKENSTGFLMKEKMAGQASLTTMTPDKDDIWLDSPDIMEVKHKMDLKIQSSNKEELKHNLSEQDGGQTQRSLELKELGFEVSKQLYFQEAVDDCSPIMNNEVRIKKKVEKVNDNIKVIKDCYFKFSKSPDLKTSKAKAMLSQASLLTPKSKEEYIGFKLRKKLYREK